MTDDKNLKATKVAFKTFCDMLDDIEFHYTQDDEDMTISFSMTGEDIPVSVIIFFDVDRQLIRASSLIPATFKDEDKGTAALAACIATSWTEDGVFEMDYEKGKIRFRMIASFVDSLLSKSAMRYMVYNVGATVDEFNDNFLMLSKGKLTLPEFRKLYQ